ncbi:MAG: U32 family peptidase [Lachnospiraceae bacterium]|nr:U32 family peptidase [Lachnospiraceae bacterium]
MGERKKPELLIPAKGPEELKVAVNFGADAVYIGGETMGLRSGARNFTLEEMEEGIAFAHGNGVKVYVTANILAHNPDLKEAAAFFAETGKLRPDAFIIADPGVFSLARELAPDTDIHISTQANNINLMTFLFWGSLGAKRIVAGRELSLDEIKEIRLNIPPKLEIEAFVHGAMCVSYSGRCLLSNYLTGRDANRGECAHPCRWKYAVMEETRPGAYMPIEENGRGTFIFNSRDLCMIEHIPELIEAGIDSFKVEGRMKNALYVASVTRSYRRAIDDYFTSPELYRENLNWYLEEVISSAARPFSTGFFFGKPGNEAQNTEEGRPLRSRTLLGVVSDTTAEGGAVIRQKNKFSLGEKVELMHTDFTGALATVLRIESEDGTARESAPHPAEKLRVTLSEPARKYDVIRSTDS